MAEVRLGSEQRFCPVPPVTCHNYLISLSTEAVSPRTDPVTC